MASDPKVQITPEVVAKVARLARLNLSPEDLIRAAEQLSGMLEHFHDIDQLDLSHVSPMPQPFPLKNILREDVVVPGLDRQEVLNCAPAAEDGRFRVPPTVGFDA